MIKSCGERIIVEKMELKRTPGKIIIPNETDDIICQVIAKGSKVDENIAVNDYVIIQHRAGYPVDIDSKGYLSIMQHEVIAVISGE